MSSPDDGRNMYRWKAAPRATSAGATSAGAGMAADEGAGPHGPHGSHGPHSPPVEGKNVHGLDVRDPLYGMVHLGPTAAAIMRSEPFARLRRLRQLGFVDLVYPGATGTRAVHSVGVAHMSRRMGAVLHAYAKEYRRPTDGDPRVLVCLEVAGLCHDLGHGPFSHSFELAVHSAAPDVEWDHERIGVSIVRALWRSDPQVARAARTEGLETPELELIVAMIAGSTEGIDPEVASRVARVPWIMQVVHNAASGLDADRIDYLWRDAHFTGLPPTVDRDRLVSKLVVAPDGRMGLKISELRQFNNMGDMRAQMSMHVYMHDLALAADTMFVNACKHSAQFAEIMDRVRSTGDGERGAAIVKIVSALDDSFLDKLADARTESSETARSIATALLARRVWRRRSFIVEADARRYAGIDGTETVAPSFMTRRYVHYGSGDDDPISAIQFLDAEGCVVRPEEHVDMAFARSVKFSTESWLVVTPDPDVSLALFGRES